MWIYGLSNFLWAEVDICSATLLLGLYYRPLCVILTRRGLQNAAYCSLYGQRISGGGRREADEGREVRRCQRSSFGAHKYSAFDVRSTAARHKDSHSLVLWSSCSSVYKGCISLGFRLRDDTRACAVYYDSSKTAWMAHIYCCLGLLRLFIERRIVDKAMKYWWLQFFFLHHICNIFWFSQKVVNFLFAAIWYSLYRVSEAFITIHTHTQL